MAKILHTNDDQIVIKLSGSYGYSIIELLATISPYSVELARLSDTQTPHTFRLSKDEMKELVGSWQLFQQKRAEETEAYTKAHEDARIAEEKRLEAVKEEAYNTAHQYGIVIEEMDDTLRRLVLPNGKTTICTKTIDDLMMQLHVCVAHMEKEAAQVIEETQLL